MFVKDGHLTYQYNYAGLRQSVIRSDRKLPSGKVEIAVDFTPGIPMPGTSAQVRLLFGSDEVAAGEVPNTTPFRFSVYESFNIGADLLTPVSQEYAVPFAFTGKILKAVFDLR